MRDEELRDRWTEETRSPPPDRDGCPPPEVLLDLAEQEILSGGGEEPGPDRNEVLLHLARCSACREDVAVAGALLRAARGEGVEAPSPRPHGSAGGGSVADARGPGMSRRPSLALAASVVLAVGLGGGVLVRWVVSGGGDGPILRGGAAHLPAAAATCSEPGIVELRWAAVPGAERYRVELFTEAGDRVVGDEVVGTVTRLVLPRGSPPAGTPLLHVVEAELSGGTVLTSPATLLPPDCLPPG